MGTLKDWEKIWEWEKRADFEMDAFLRHLDCMERW